MSRVAISSDEKLFAFSTNRGTVCLVEVGSKNIQVYNEHLGTSITSMKWNEHTEELYVGDSTGKMSVVINANFIVSYRKTQSHFKVEIISCKTGFLLQTKTMFQTPCSPLLQLDSKVTQIDTCCNFILASTLTRCYLCDTEKEHYRQIGQKLRDGEYGACFYGPNNVSPTSIRQQQPGSFRILSDKESFNTLGLENLKMFCARPGLRLWEVRIDGTVVRTHQFRQVLNTKADRVVAIHKTDRRLEISNDIKSISGSTNFIKMSMLARNFVLTFKRDAIYVLDPLNGRVVVWIDKFSDIVDVMIVRNFIYVWTQSRDLHVLLFSNFENFILKCLFNKQYLLCSDLVVRHEKQIRDIVPFSSKLHVLNILDEKLLEIEELELREQILPILQAIKSDEKKSGMKLENGIFIIDNAHFINNEISENAPIELPVELPVKETDNKDVEKIFEQYELDKAIGNYNSKVLIDILKDCTPEKIFDVFKNLETHALSLQTNGTDIKSWGYEKCLKYIYKHRDYNLLIYNLDLDDGFGAYIRDGFVYLNRSPERTCTCGFPLPNASDFPPVFPEIGTSLVNKLVENNLPYNLIIRDVPYLWKHILTSQLSENLTQTLPLLMQFSDETLFDVFLKKFSYDHWNEALKLFAMLKKGKCLKCEKSFAERFEGISWTSFATFILRSIGSETTVNLLLEHADVIPKSAFEADFYQSLIFSSVAENYQPALRKNSIDFVRDIKESDVKGDVSVGFDFDT